MTIYKAKGINFQELNSFKKLQQRVFFTKTDLPLLQSKIDKVSDLKIKKRQIEQISKIALGFKPSFIYQLGRSTFHKVYQIKVLNKNYILRINALSKNFKELSFLTEEWIMQSLKKRGLPSLRIYLTDISRSKVPFDYQVVDFAVGESLHDLVKKGLDKPDSFYKLGRLIAKLHTISTKKFGPFDVKSMLFHKSGQGIYESWFKYIRCNLKSHLNYCNNIGVITRKEKNYLTSLFEKYTRLILFNEPKLLHGDLANHNVMIKNNKISSLIDWEDCMSGDPAFDIAYYGTGCYLHPKWFKTFIDGYKTIQKLTPNFWQRYWLYYLRIALSKTVLRHKLGKMEKNAIDPYSSRIKLALNEL